MKVFEMNNRMNKNIEFFSCRIEGYEDEGVALLAKDGVCWYQWFPNKNMWYRDENEEKDPFSYGFVYKNLDFKEAKILQKLIPNFDLEDKYIKKWVAKCKNTSNKNYVRSNSQIFL